MSLYNVTFLCYPDILEVLAVTQIGEALAQMLPIKRNRLAGHVKTPSLPSRSRWPMTSGRRGTGATADSRFIALLPSPVTRSVCCVVNSDRAADSVRVVRCRVRSKLFHSFTS
ncbi:hypothetical protein J6590_044163 [Homalodisca vitripennis]|nr:hypothetical protein J6590_044163 [Homalodisca vitripennis]